MGNNLPAVDLGTNVTVSREYLPTVVVEVDAPTTPAPVVSPDTRERERKGRSGWSLTRDRRANV